MNKIINISDYKYLNDLERSYYEQQSYGNIIAYMLSTNSYQNDGFKYYENKYNETLKNYDFQKNQFEQLIVLPISEIMGNNKIQWEIDFHQKEVKIFG